MLSNKAISLFNHLLGIPHCTFFILHYHTRHFAPTGVKSLGQKVYTKELNLQLSPDKPHLSSNMTHFPFSIPHSSFHIPHYKLHITNSSFPITNYSFFITPS